MISFFTLYYAMFQHLEDLHKSVNQYFLKYLKACNVIKSFVSRRLFNVGARPVDFNVTEYKFINVVSDSTF